MRNARSRWSEINLGVIKITIKEPSHPFLDELSHPQPSTKIFAKKKGLAIYLRDDLGNTHFIMVSAVHQFEHTAKRKCDDD